METKRRRAAKRAAAWAVGLGVAALAAWWAFDLWAERRLAEAADWYAEPPEAAVERAAGPDLGRLQAEAPAFEWSAGEREGLEALAAAAGRRWTPEERDVARRLVAARQAELSDLVRRLRGDRAPTPPGPRPAASRAGAASAGVPENDQHLLRGSRLLATAARLALEDGRPERTVEGAEALAALARAYEGRPDLYHQILASSFEIRFLSLLADLLASPDVRRGHLERLGDSLIARDPEDAVRRAVRGEGRIVLAALEDPDPGWAGGRVSAPCTELEVARVLDGYRELAETPGTDLHERPDARARSGRRATLSAMLIPNIVEAVTKMRAMAASRQLARLALALRLAALDDGAYPARLASLPGAGEPDPFAGGRPRWEVGPEGAVLSNPAADALWERVGRPAGPPFTWRLPA